MLQVQVEGKTLGREIKWMLQVGLWCDMIEPSWFIYA